MITFKERLKNAICNNDIDFLIKNKNQYDINERFEDEDNETLLLYAICDYGSESYKYFLNNNADITLVNNSGENIIHEIIYSGDLDRLKDILGRYDIDLNQQRGDGGTPLLLSICLDKFEMAKYLIQKGANVNISDEDDITPLHRAVQSYDLELVKELVKYGADLTKKTNNGNCPLAMAANDTNNNDIIKYLYKSIYES